MTAIEVTTIATTDRHREDPPMCFDERARPPIAPIRGGAIDSGPLTLNADDGNLFRAFAARASRGGRPSAAAVIILPDVRGLHRYYEELALRFAERGVDAIAIDYFGRTVGTEARESDFDFLSHVARTTFAGLATDIGAAADLLRSTAGGSARSIFTIGFCFGGRLAFLSGTLGLDLAGVIGFYGWPAGPTRNDMPAPIDVAGRIGSPVLGIFGGADENIRPQTIDSFRHALERAGVANRIVTYEGAPHSFFDRKATEFAAASEAAWEEVQSFIRGNSGGHDRSHATGS
jgi:carboxymethylenebutenolidase